MTWSQFEALPVAAQIAVLFAVVAAAGLVGYAVETMIAARRQQKAIRSRPPGWWDKYPTE